MFSYHCNAEHMGMFSKDEFVSALVKLGCDSVEKLRERLPDLAAELDADVTFRNVYGFAFLFAREVPHHQSMPFPLTPGRLDWDQICGKDYGDCLVEIDVYWETKMGAVG